MRLTTDKNDWTPIDSNLENELLNAYERIAELEGQLGVSERSLSCERSMLLATTRALNERIAELERLNKAQAKWILVQQNLLGPYVHSSLVRKQELPPIRSGSIDINCSVPFMKTGSSEVTWVVPKQAIVNETILVEDLNKHFPGVLKEQRRPSFSYRGEKLEPSITINGVDIKTLEKK